MILSNRLNFNSFFTFRPYLINTLYLVILLSFINLFSCSPSTTEQQNTLVFKSQSDSTWLKMSEAEKREVSAAISGLTVADDLEISLFASEPMMINPTNMDIDSKGRVWITEAYNYRFELNPSNPTKEEGDRILILEDINGDGKADKEKVFYQGTDINAALGIWVMGNKAIVSVSPNVFVLTDTNGDDVADEKEILFTGIGGVQHDHAIHAFSFGPDGKLYFNYGNEGEQLLDKNGNVVVDKAGRKVVGDGKPYQQGMVFRMNPDGTEFEVLGHNFRNNFEVAVDSYGTLWQSDNDDDGNRAVRINYVMEFGNYGYRDEMTGAGWRARRTNMEEEIPLQHWHLNDPGVIPNLLQTGAGSPTGILVYEGNLLPERFLGQMIHADAGPNVVRSYPVKKEKAGYSAEINDIVKGKDQWFRPSDVTVAPDGSLFIADWYDPGVGGHLMGDQERGRVYRVAPEGAEYSVPTFNYDTPEAAVEALKNPNLSVRYLAWTALNKAGKAAEPALKKLWNDSDPRFRARALWLLSKMEGASEDYIAAALKDKDEDIRITGIRAARQKYNNALPYIKELVNDPSAQVRREMALALRLSKSAEAPELWARLAQQHDGNDRWYLEALGIGAEEQWDKFYDAWLKTEGLDLNSKAAKDIVWRARTSKVLPQLSQYIASENVDQKERLRYFRAFDFHNDPSKQAVITDLLAVNHPEKDQIIETALLHLDPKNISSPKIKAALNQTLDKAKGTIQFVDLVDRFNIKDRHKDLVELVISYPDDPIGVDAAKILMNRGGKNLLVKELEGNVEANTTAILKVLAHVQNDESINMLQSVMMDSQRKLSTRQLAVKSLGQGWNGEDKLLEIVKAGRLSADLEHAAANILTNAYRGHIREGAMEFLKVGTSERKEDLPSINELVARTGNPENGKQVFTQTCNSCHLINGEGTNFGPELSEIGNKLSKNGLYMAIIHPDAGISFGYEGFIVKLKDGNVKLGFIISETESELELRMSGGITSKIKNEEILSKSQIENSLMPKNLHHTMTEQELVDLVAYLSSLKKATAMSK